MIKLPEPGLYRTTKPYPGQEIAIPANVLVYVGKKPDGSAFAVRPGNNTRNRWFWGEPTVPLRSPSWGSTLIQLPSEGFYTLHKEIDMGNGGKWLKNAIVQLGYNGEGKGIIFVGEDHQKEENNVLKFSDTGMIMDDEFIKAMNWAPILPVSGELDLPSLAASSALAKKPARLGTYGDPWKPIERVFSLL